MFQYPTAVSVANNRLTQLSQSVFEPILSFFVNNNFAADGISSGLAIEQSKWTKHFNEEIGKILIRLI